MSSRYYVRQVFYLFLCKNLTLGYYKSKIDVTLLYVLLKSSDKSVTLQTFLMRHIPKYIV